MEPGRRRLLLVDDHEGWRRATARVLRGRFDVVGVASGEEALPLIEKETADFDLVLLDLNLGKGHLRGDEILRQIVERWPNLSVVILTVENALSPAVELMKLGARDYLYKEQCPPPVLLQRLDQILASVDLDRQVRLLRIMLQARPEAAHAHRPGPGPEAALPLLPSELVVSLDELNRDSCTMVLQACGGNIRETARRLQVAYSTLRDDLVRWRVVGPGSGDDE
ncbi:MAG: response regulator [Deltaproteobacteria bacterium]|nr:response regulator [Deltaproteobacteria bacterium]